MIPAEPKEFDERSHEGRVFQALKKLSDDYYVFHSVAAVGVTSNNEFYEREIDFVVASYKKGIVAIEVKAGNNISYKDRTWYYSGGKPMTHGGPYHQAATAKRALINKLRDHKDERIRDIFQRCKLMHAVCFPDMTSEKMTEMRGLPEEADLRITICSDDLTNPNKKLAEIFSVKLPVKRDESENKMTEEDFELVLDEVLCPHFHLVPSPRAKTITLNDNMYQLLREQYILLDFLEEQQSAVINGAAGTGKTMVAIEKARRHSINGEKVLFLCYSRLLCDKLIEENKNNPNKEYSKQFQNVDFMTISKLAFKITGNFKDYESLYDWLLQCIDKKEELGYKHIIIDEGQDFGLIDTEFSEEGESGSQNVSIIDALQLAALENEGTFYLFYDKKQMIQGFNRVDYPLPDCIENTDCRLTLHRNCRNTKEIARTSITPLRIMEDNFKRMKEKKINVAYSWQEPIKPVLHFTTEKAKATLNKVLQKLEEKDVNDIVILSPGSFEDSSIYSDLIFSQGYKDPYGYYLFKGKKIRASTCMRFKGLEAEAVIIIDLNKDSFKEKKGLEFYVGSSRAKYYLDIICTLDTHDYFDLAHGLDNNAPNREDPNRMKKVIANIFAAEIE